MSSTKKQTKRVAIFGGSGFVGTELSNQYRASGATVKVITRIRQNRSSEASGADIVINYNKHDFKKLLRSLSVDTIIFLSSNPYPGLSEFNAKFDIDYTVTPFVELLEAVRELKIFPKIWYTSSVAVYGALPKKEFSELDKPEPISSYGISKLCCENYAKLFAEKDGLNIGTIRLFSTFGPQLRRQVIYDLYCKATKNESFELLSAPADARDLIFVEDAARAIIHINDEFNPRFEIINVGSGKPIKIKTIAQKVADIVGFKGNITTQNDRVRSFDGSSWCANISKLHKSGFRLKHTFDQGLEKTLSAWEKSNQ